MQNIQYNNTQTILPYLSEERRGVILPNSGKVLNDQDINKKIEKLTSRIEHLTAQQSQKRTHGGKASRAKMISLKRQISLASDQVTLLQRAKAAIPTTPISAFFSDSDSDDEMFQSFSRVQLPFCSKPTTGPSTSSTREQRCIDTALRIHSLVSQGLPGGKQSTGYSVGEPSTVFFGGKVHTFTQIHVKYN